MTTKIITISLITCIGYQIFFNIFGILGVFLLVWIMSIQLGRMIYKKYEGVEIIHDLADFVAALCCGPVVLATAIFECWPNIKHDYGHIIPTLRNPFVWKKDDKSE